MPMSWRLIRPMLLVTLLAALLFPLATGPVAAQDGGDDERPPVIIQGSTEMEDLVMALRDAFSADYDEIDVQFDFSGGPRVAFDALCSGGDVDIVMSTAPIDDAQVAACAREGYDFIELVLAYEAVVLLATPEADLACITPQDAFDAWELGAPEDVLWIDLGALALDTPIMFYGPTDDLTSYDLFRLMTPAEAFREEYTGAPDVNDVLAVVAEEESSAFGFMSLAEFEALDNEADIVPMALQDETGACYGPSVSTLGAGTYPLARTNYFYVAAESAEDPDVLAFLQFVLAGEAGIQALGVEQGYTVADAGTYDYDMSNLTTLNVGRTFTRPPTPVTLSTGDLGTVSITGTAMLRDLTNDLEGVFTTQYLNAEVYTGAVGNTAGWADFCAGNADVLATTRVPTDEELALCEENGIDPYLVDLGYEALVLAVPAANDWLDCLDSTAAATLFRAGAAQDAVAMDADVADADADDAEAEDADADADADGDGGDEVSAALLWSDVNEAWPELDILLVVPERHAGEADFLVSNLIGELTFPMRTDVVVDADVEYRVQGVGYTDNGLTYAWWTEAQGIEADVQYVPVGEACVVPTAETIADGSYPLSFPVRYYVAQSQFENPMVRAFLWNFFNESALAEIDARGYVGLDIDAMELTQREDVYAMLAQFEEDAAAAAEADDADADDAEDADADDAEDADADDAEAEDADADDAEDADADDADAGADDAEAEDAGADDAEAEDADADDAEAEACDE
ncbi:MAG: substrate-binding domain-containing protein [Anaerolineae bacterium]|nr:substrate-binding domain-containing protein [Anaerolineae bacterium]